MEERLSGSPSALSGEKNGVLSVSLTDFGENNGCSGIINIKYRKGLVDILRDKMTATENAFCSNYKDPIEFYMFALSLAKALNLETVDVEYISKQAVNKTATLPVTNSPTKVVETKKEEAKPNVQNTVPGSGSKVSGQEGKGPGTVPVGLGSKEPVKATVPNVPPVHKA